jgi:hypothetical protein
LAPTASSRQSLQTGFENTPQISEKIPDGRFFEASPLCSLLENNADLFKGDSS